MGSGSYRLILDAPDPASTLAASRCSLSQLLPVTLLWSFRGLRGGLTKACQSLESAWVASFGIYGVAFQSLLRSARVSRRDARTKSLKSEFRGSFCLVLSSHST